MVITETALDQSKLKEDIVAILFDDLEIESKVGWVWV